MPSQSYEEIWKLRFREITAGILLILLLFSWGIGHASARGVVQTVDVGFYDADQMKQPANINGENQWNNGTYSDTKINKNNVVFDIRDKLAIEATLTISPTSGTWVYYPANISGNVISYTNARGRIAYEDQDTILKETIILNAPVSSISWVLNLSMKPQSLGFSTDTDGYSINDPTNPDQRIEIPFPYVTDALGVRRDLRYSWNNGQKRLTLTQDFAGLQYPMVIDPSYVVDTTGNVGFFSQMMINTSGIPQVAYTDGTNSKIKLFANTSGILSVKSIMGANSLVNQPLGSSIDPITDQPIFSSGGISQNTRNFTWWSSGNWRTCQTSLNYGAISIYSHSVTVKTSSGRTFITFLNGTNGAYNITRIEDITGTGPISTYEHTIPGMGFLSSSSTFSQTGKLNASNILNLFWKTGARLNLTTVTDSVTPSISTLTISTTLMNSTASRYDLIGMDIDPTTDFPAVVYKPATASSGNNNGRALNYSWFSGATWHHETVYENTSSPGMSEILGSELTFNSSGYAYVSFIESRTSAANDYARTHILYTIRTAANTWTTPIELDSNAHTRQAPSSKIDSNGGLHIAWTNGTYLDLSYYFEPLPSAAAGSAPVASFVCSPIAGVRNATRTCTDASTNTPTSWAWWSPSSGVGCVLNGSLPANQNPSIAPLNFSYCGICLTATNAFGSGSTCKANYLYTSQPQTVI